MRPLQVTFALDDARDLFHCDISRFTYNIFLFLAMKRVNTLPIGHDQDCHRRTLLLFQVEVKRYC